MAELAEIYRSMVDNQSKSKNPVLYDYYNDAISIMRGVILTSDEFVITSNDQKKLDSLIETLKQKLSTVAEANTAELNTIITFLESFQEEVNIEIADNMMEIKENIYGINHVNDEERKRETPSFPKEDISSFRPVSSSGNLSSLLRSKGIFAGSHSHSTSTTRSNTPLSQGSSSRAFDSGEEGRSTSTQKDINETFRRIEAAQELFKTRNLIIQELGNSMQTLVEEKWLGLIHKDNTTTINALKELVTNIKKDPTMHISIDAQVMKIEERYKKVKIERYSETVKNLHVSPAKKTFDK